MRETRTLTSKITRLPGKCFRLKTVFIDYVIPVSRYALSRIGTYRRVDEKRMEIVLVKLILPNVLNNRYRCLVILVHFIIVL